MELFQLHEHIILVKDFLSPKKCESLIRISEHIGYQRSKIQLADGTQVYATGIRNNKRILYDSQELAELYWNISKTFLPSSLGDYTAIGLNERFRFYKYEVGEQFKMHKDGSFERNENECSFFTFLIYLNADFEGGTTSFEDLFTVRPEQGSLLVFYHPIRHQGDPVLNGTKYVLRTDVMFQKNKLKS